MSSLNPELCFSSKLTFIGWRDKKGCTTSCIACKRKKHLLKISMFLFHGCAFIPHSTYESIVIRHKKETDQFQLFREHWCNFCPQFLIVRGPDVRGEEMQLSCDSLRSANMSSSMQGEPFGQNEHHDSSQTSVISQGIRRIVMRTYVTLDKWFTHISLKQFPKIVYRTCIGISGAEIPFAPWKPIETLPWLWDWIWGFTETICFIHPIPQRALNTVQNSQPSPGRSHFLSSEEGGSSWMPWKHQDQLCCISQAGQVDGTANIQEVQTLWLCTSKQWKVVTPKQFKRYLGMCLDNNVTWIQQFHHWRPVESSRY